LLTFHWLLTVAAVVVATVALIRARRANKRLERLTETYWELRYDHGQLRARLDRLEPQAPASQTDGQSAQAAKSGNVQFVPLSSLKR
jgi:hypothetical protein